MTAGEDKRARIVQATVKALMQGGVTGLSFGVIADQAGLSRQLVRYYFSDNEALMVAVCDHLADAYRTALIEGVAAVEETSRLSFFLDFYFDFIEDRRKPRDDQAYDAMFAAAAGHESVRKNLNMQYGLLGQVVSHEIQLQHPALSSEECLELSYLFVCLMYGHWKMVASLGYAEEHRHISRRAMDRLLKSYNDGDLEPLSPVKTWSLNS